MSQQRQNTISTQKRVPSDAPTLAPEDTGKADFAYATIVDSGQIHSDLTGRFPTISAKGNTYVLVLYAYDTNNVLTEPRQAVVTKRWSEPTTNSSKSLSIMVLSHAYIAKTMNVQMHSAPYEINMTSNSNWRLLACIAVTPMKEQSKLTKVTILLDFARLIPISLSASGTAILC
jgi:hypothetical protein